MTEGTSQSLENFKSAIAQFWGGTDSDRKQISALNPFKVFVCSINRPSRVRLLKQNDETLLV